MGVLDSLIKFRELEDAKEQRDVQAIGASISNFINIKRQNRLDELDTKLKTAQIDNLLSQVETRGSQSKIDDLVKFSTLAARGQELKDESLLRAGQAGIDSTLGISQPNPVETINRELSPVAQISQDTASQIDSVNQNRDLLTQTDIFGDPTGAAIREKKKLETETEISKQVQAEQEKKNVKSQRDLINAELKIDNTFDSFLDVADRTFQITGVKPGLAGGVINTVLGPTKANEFIEGFTGGLVEFAAAVGAVAIPGARAVRLVKLFEKTAPTTYSSIESAIQTSADSFRNGLSSDMAQNPESYIEGFNNLSSEDKRESITALKDQLKFFEKSFKESLLIKAYKKNPELLSAESRKKVESNINQLEKLNLDPNEFEIVGE